MSTVSRGGCPRPCSGNVGVHRLHPDPGPLLLPGGGLPEPPAQRVHRHRGAHTRTPGGSSERTKLRPPPARSSRTPGGRPQPPESPRRAGGGGPPACCRRRPPRSPDPPRRCHPGQTPVPAAPTRLAKRRGRSAARERVARPAPGWRRAPGMRGRVPRVLSAAPAVEMLVSQPPGDCPRRLLGNKGAGRGRRAQGTQNRKERQPTFPQKFLKEGALGRWGTKVQKNPWVPGQLRKTLWSSLQL